MPTDPAPLDPAGQSLPMRTISVVYDGPGRIVSATDSPGPVRWTIYDDAGRVIDRGTGPAPSSGDPPAPGPENPPDEPHIVGG